MPPTTPSPKPWDLEWSARYFGLKRDSAGALRFRPEPGIRYPSSIPKRTLENIAACASVGLHFWCEHHRTNLLWAVDASQRVHEVMIDRKTQKAEHRCYRNYSYDPTTKHYRSGDPQRCERLVQGITTWAIAPTMNGLGDQLALTTTKENTQMPTPTPASDKTSKARHDAKMLRGKELIAGSPENKRAMAKRGKLGTPLDADRAEKAMAAAVNAGTARRKAAGKSVYDANAEKPMTRAVARSLLLHDPDYLGDITNAALVDLLEDESVKKYHPRIRRELKSARGLTERKAS